MIPLSASLVTRRAYYLSKNFLIPPTPLSVTDSGASFGDAREISIAGRHGRSRFGQHRMRRRNSIPSGRWLDADRAEARCISLDAPPMRLPKRGG